MERDKLLQWILGKVKDLMDSPIFVRMSLFGDPDAYVDVILDEDDMASDDAQGLATQQSIKAYADTKVQLTTEEVQDIIGAMLAGNTETRITVTYEDGDGTIDLVVDDMTADTQLTTEQVQDIVGAMFSGNTETRVAVTYEDGDGTIDLVVDDMNDGAPLTTEQVQDIIGAMLSGNTETDITVTYQDADGTIDFVVTGGGGGAILKFCSRYGPSNNTYLNTSWVTVQFATANREDTDYFTYSSGEITLLEAGDYKISFHVTGEEHAIPDDNRWHVYAKLQQKAAAGSFADVAGTEITGYATSSNESDTITSAPIIYTAVANDVIRVLAKGNQTGVQLEANTSRIMIEFIE